MPPQLSRGKERGVLFCVLTLGSFPYLLSPGLFKEITPQSAGHYRVCSILQENCSIHENNCNFFLISSSLVQATGGTFHKFGNTKLNQDQKQCPNSLSFLLAIKFFQFPIRIFKNQILRDVPKL